jgi:hypothetical protein
MLDIARKLHGSDVAFHAEAADVAIAPDFEAQQFLQPNKPFDVVSAKVREGATFVDFAPNAPLPDVYGMDPYDVIVRLKAAVVKFEAAAKALGSTAVVDDRNVVDAGFTHVETALVNSKPPQTFTGLGGVAGLDRRLAHAMIFSNGHLRKVNLDAQLASRQQAKSDTLAQARHLRNSADEGAKATLMEAIVTITISVVAIGGAVAVMKSSGQSIFGSMKNGSKTPPADAAKNVTDDVAKATGKADAVVKAPPTKVADDVAEATADADAVVKAPPTKVADDVAEATADANAVVKAPPTKVADDVAEAAPTPADGPPQVADVKASLADDGTPPGGGGLSKQDAGEAAGGGKAGADVDDAAAAAKAKSDAAAEKTNDRRMTLVSAITPMASPFGRLVAMDATETAKIEDARASEKSAMSEEKKGEGDVEREAKQAADEMLKAMISFVKSIAATHADTLRAITK